MIVETILVRDVTWFTRCCNQTKSLTVTTLEKGIVGAVAVLGGTTLTHIAVISTNSITELVTFVMLASSHCHWSGD